MFSGLSSTLLRRGQTIFIPDPYYGV
ncbi:hypothetical protein PDE_09102 [Penicillium oxalicum 114-2]|uniref:Uncharacterized protein n=1 Tax=Penicillium oxalicum (strain 114-2 / CGMCC 5302) TaxID=933388 RepID=S7ZTU8_PENO1|nr:hypothetical protein PDE_09102 [Penicillium oxalicum 114-2]